MGLARIVFEVPAEGTIPLDDRVESRILLEPAKSAAWREWEIELVDGQRKLLDAAGTVIALLGHLPAELPSKLARALGARYPAGSPSPPRPRRKGPASALLLSYLHEQVEALKTQTRASGKGPRTQYTSSGWPHAGCARCWRASAS